MLYLIFLLFNLSSFDKIEGYYVGRGIASMYRPWKIDKYVPYGRYPGLWKVKPTKNDLVCAHRKLPFGSILRITNLKNPDKKAYCVVLDRGTYGQCNPIKNYGKDRKCPKGFKYSVSAKKPAEGGYFRGILDATPKVHEMMGSKGWTLVRVEKLKLRRYRRVLRVNN